MDALGCGCRTDDRCNQSSFQSQSTGGKIKSIGKEHDAWHRKPNIKAEGRQREWVSWVGAEPTARGLEALNVYAIRVPGL